jgi:hypothetical protein
VSSVHKMVFRHPGEKAWLYRMGNLRATWRQLKQQKGCYIGY